PPLLARHVGEIRFRQTPLSQCLEILAKRADVPMTVKWESLAALEIKPTTLISLDAPNLSLEAAVAQLRSSGRIDEPRIHARQEGDIIIVDAGAPPEPDAVIRTYDVSDLLA